MRLYLTRHGETEWNVQKRMQGRKNSNLTDLGVMQAEWLRERLKEVSLDAVYSSTSGRAFKTAEIISEGHKVEIKPSEEIMEISLGDWEGLTFEEAEKSYPGEYTDFWENPEKFNISFAESYEDVHNRTVDFINKLYQEHKGQEVLIVTHGIILKVLMTYFAKEGIADIKNVPFMKQTSLNIVEFSEDDFKIIVQGDISHHQA